MHRNNLYSHFDKKYLLILFFLIVASVNVFGDEKTLRKYPLYDHGNLQLSVSDSWRDKTEQQLNYLPPTIMFTPLYGTSFHILVSPMWAYKEGLVMPTVEEIKQLINLAAESAKDQAVEDSIIINQFEDTPNNGYYYSATDKAPKPGEYKYMTQGMLRIGELFTTFTILTNDDSVDVAAEALSMLSGAIHLQKETQ